MLEISVVTLFKAANGLKSEDGENPEYDRALVELLSDVTLSAADQVASLLDIQWERIYPK